MQSAGKNPPEPQSAVHVTEEVWKPATAEAIFTSLFPPLETKRAHSLIARHRGFRRGGRRRRRRRRRGRKHEVGFLANSLFASKKRADALGMLLTSLLAVFFGTYSVLKSPKTIGWYRLIQYTLQPITKTRFLRTDKWHLQKNLFPVYATASKRVLFLSPFLHDRYGRPSPTHLLNSYPF